MEGTCRICKQLTDLPDYRVRISDFVCRPCRNLAARKGKPAMRQFHSDDERKLRARVRVYTRRKIKQGKLVRSPCEICGANAEAHHDDYSLPLNVRWLCRPHHRQIHDQI